MKSIYLLFILFCSFIVSSCNDGGASASIELIPVKSGTEFGYVDWNGKIVINPQFSYAGLFNDGLALIATSGNDRQYGYIDADGSYVINPQFVQATAFNDGIALVVKVNEAPKGINKKGETVFELKSAESVREFSEGLAAFSVSGADGLKWGFIDKTGKTIINPQFNGVAFFKEGKCAVMNNSGKWGYIDTQGKIVINNQFDAAGKFENGKAVVNNGNKAGLIDTDGKYLINPQFGSMIPDGNKFVISSGGKVGWADGDGKIIINPQFDGAYPFRSGELAPVKQNSQWGYVDSDGKYVINPQFDNAFPFVGGKAIVQSGGNIGIIDTNGNYVVNPQFDDLSPDYANIIFSARNAMVTSDYFDVEAIANGVKKEITASSASGFNFTTPLSEMMAKYPGHKLNYYYGSNYLFQNREINKYASLSLAVEGTIYIQQGWSYVPNPDASAGSFTYLINLTGKAYGKTEDIFKALENGFEGFTKVANPTGGRAQFSSDNFLATVGVINGQVAVRITPAHPVQPEGSAEEVALAAPN